MVGLRNEKFSFHKGRERQMSEKRGRKSLETREVKEMEWREKVLGPELISIKKVKNNQLRKSFPSFL